MKFCFCQNVSFRMAVKRFRSSDFAGNPRTLRPRGGYKGSGRGGVKRRRVSQGTSLARRAVAGVARLNRMIETKEQSWRSQENVAMPHNNLHIVNDLNANPLNIFSVGQGAADGMGVNGGQRIGDSIAIRGVSIRAFFENALARSKVYYRFMVVKMAKGDTLNRANLFKGDATNKMIDQINTERFTIIAQKTFNIYGKGDSIANSVSAAGVPLEAPTIAGDYVGGIGSKTFKMWIPGRKFGRHGVIQYENNSSTQVKFFDYRLCIVCYDWYGTPQDVNNIGRINELYTKLYFKDA